MGERRKGRECALQLLYQADVAKDSAQHFISDNFWAEQNAGEQAKGFALELIEGVQSFEERLDKIIAKHSEHWKVGRMAAVDKNVLRIATYELLYREDIPQKVTLNEAIEIAKRFGTEESGAFVNGILDKIAHDLRKT